LEKIMGNNKPNFERTTKNLDRKMADRKMEKRKPNVYGLKDASLAVPHISVCHFSV